MEHTKQLTAATANELSPEDFKGEWYCNTCLLLGLQCTPDVVRGLCQPQQKQQFLQQLVELADVVNPPYQAFINTEVSSDTSTGAAATQDEASHATSSIDTTTDSTSLRASTATTATTSSSTTSQAPPSRPRSAAPDRPTSRPSSATPSGPSGPHSQLHSLQQSVLQSWSDFIPQHLPLFPHDIQSTLDTSSLAAADIAQKVQELRHRIEALQADVQSCAGEQGGFSSAEGQLVALQRLEVQFRSFLAAVEQFRRWCQEEVGVWGRLAASAPEGDLGGAAEQLVMQQRQLQRAVDSLESLRILHQRLAGPSPTGRQQGTTEERLQQLAQTAQEGIDSLSISHATLQRYV